MLCFHAAQTGNHLLRPRNVSEQNQKHFLCPQQMLRARANGGNISTSFPWSFISPPQRERGWKTLGTRLETFVTATMCPEQCALVRKGHMILILSSRMNIAKLTGSALPCVTTWEKSLRYSKRTLRDKLLSGFYRDVCLRVRVETERMFCHI